MADPKLCLLEGYKNPIPLINASDGTLRLLAYNTLLNQSELPPLIAIEEPERSLHPGALKEIAYILEKLAERTQVIITTHSSQLLDTFSSKSLADWLGVLLLRNRPGLGTEVLNLEAIRDKREALKGWIADFGIGSAVFDSGLLQDLMEEPTMLSVRVWNLQSDCDAKAVKFLENEFFRFRQLGDIAIRTAGSRTLRKCHTKGTPISSRLRKAIENYFKQDDYIIFLIDADQQHQQKSNSLINQLRHVVKDCSFSHKVFFVPDIQECDGSILTQWQNIVSRFRTEVENERKRFREEWNRTVAHFHNAFADIPGGGSDASF